MTRELKISNAMAIAYTLSKENECRHLTISCCTNYVEISLFYDLNDEKVKATYERIKKSTSYTPKYENPKFYADGFEVLQMKWEF